MVFSLLRDIHPENGMDVVWLSIGATLMGISLIVMLIRYLEGKKRRKREGEEVEEKEGEEGEEQGKEGEEQGGHTIISSRSSAFSPSFLAIIVVFLAFISYIFMLFASLYSTHENVTLVRYVEWFITTPLLLIDLALIARLRFIDIYYMVLFDILMIAIGLAAVYSTHFYVKYTLFTLSTIMMICIFYVLYNPRNEPMGLDEETREKSRHANMYTTVLWSIYPIVWILSNQGLNVLSISNATFAYMILDVLAKAAFGLFFIQW